MARADMVKIFPGSTKPISDAFRQMSPSNSRLTVRVIPSSRNNQKLADLGAVYDLAAAPGFKVVIVSDTASMTYLGTGVILMAFDKIDGRATLGLATGGTWEPARYALGTFDFLSKNFGLELPVDKIPMVGTLDDYAYPLPIYRAMEGLIGTEAEFVRNKILPWSYRGEQLIWLERIGFRPDQLVSPPNGFTCSLTAAANLFREQLDSWVRPTLVQMHGIGTNGHDAFNEPPCDPLTATTRYELITDLTRFQNGFAFIPASEPAMTPMFRNVGGTFGLLTAQEIIARCRGLAQKFNEGAEKPAEFDYVKDSVWTDFMKNLEAHWARVLDVAGRLPVGAFTQGVGDLRESCGVQTSALDLIMVNGGHKRLATVRAIEGPLDPRWPASAFQAFGNALAIVEESAATMLQHRPEYFRFEPDVKTAATIQNFRSDKIDAQFWGKPLPE